MFRTKNFGIAWVFITKSLRYKSEILSLNSGYNKLNFCVLQLYRYIDKLKPKGPMIKHLPRRWASRFGFRSGLTAACLPLPAGFVLPGATDPFAEAELSLPGPGFLLPGTTDPSNEAQLTGFFSALINSKDPALLGLGNQAPQFIADVVKKCQNSVVFVEARGKHRKSKNYVQLATGSGFIVKSEESHSLVLTTAHVVGTRKSVSVKLSDGATYDAHVCVVDQVMDLAVLAVQPQKTLPVIPLGTIKTIRPGEFVAAMGSPMALHRTVTQGIISSSPLRPSTELGMKDGLNLIQTDAVIWEGNFGGPMVNMEGAAIGVNAIMLTEGIAFAIPTDYALRLIDTATDRVLKEIEKKGFSAPIFQNDGSVVQKKRYMGISMVALDPQMVLELKEKQSEFPNISSGIYVHTVNVSSPAYKSGMHAGDVIVEINGEPMDTAADVYRLVESSDFMTCKIIRGATYKTLSVETEKIELDE